jgi:hypothetical protein
MGAADWYQRDSGHVVGHDEIWCWLTAISNVKSASRQEIKH